MEISSRHGNPAIPLSGLQEEHAARLKYGSKEIAFDDIPLEGRPVRVKLTRQRYKCSECKLLFIEPVEVLSPEWRATWRLVSAIARASLHRPFLHWQKSMEYMNGRSGEYAHAFFRELDSDGTFAYAEVDGD